MSKIKIKKINLVNKAKIIETVFTEVLNALTNDYDSIWGGFWIELFGVDDRRSLSETDTLLVDDGSGNPKELTAFEIEELICSKVIDVQYMIEKSLKATNDKMILILDE